MTDHPPPRSHSRRHHANLCPARHASSPASQVPSYVRIITTQIAPRSSSAGRVSPRGRDRRPQRHSLWAHSDIGFHNGRLYLLALVIGEEADGVPNVTLAKPFLGPRPLYGAGRHRPRAVRSSCGRGCCW
jgi:hypothetical protein